MRNITLARRAGSGPSRVRGAGLAEIFTPGDGAVRPIADLASAVHTIRRLHPGGVDVILIGVSVDQGMKIVQDPGGLVSVLIGVRRGTIEQFSDGDEVLIAFDHGALRPAGVLGFLWEGGSAPEGQPPPTSSSSSGSGSGSTHHLEQHHLRRLNLL